MMADKRRFVAALGAVLSLSRGVQCFLAQSSRPAFATAGLAKQQGRSGIRVDCSRRDAAISMAAGSECIYGVLRCVVECEVP